MPDASSWPRARPARGAFDPFATQPGFDPSPERGVRSSDRYARPAANGQSDVHVEPERPVEASAADRWLAVPTADPAEHALRLAADEGGVDEALSLAAHLRTQGRDHDALPVLLRAVRYEPARLDAFEALRTVAEALRAIAILDAVDDLRSLFAPTERKEPPGSWASYLDEEGDPLGAHGPMAQALQLLWAAAPSVLQRDLATLGALGTQRVAPSGPQPLGRALARARRILGVDATLFVLPDATSIRVFPSDPPSVVAGPDLASDVPAQTFRVARAVELAREGTVGVVARAPSEARTMLQGIHAAFGEHGAAPAKDAATFATELWRVVPSRAQAAIRDALAGSECPTFDELSQTLRVRAARAGLLTDGSTARSARALLLDDPSLDGQDLSTPGGYVAASRASEPLAGLVRLSFEPGPLAARLRWLARRDRS